MDYLFQIFQQFKPSPRILLARHGEGTHLTGEKFDMRIGPSLTGKLVKGEYTGGKGHAYRRIPRQLAEAEITPDVILVSPQLRALETCAFSRLNERPLANGKPLSKVPVRILRNCYEQTKCLHNQGRIIPPLSLLNSWPNANVIKKDKSLFSAIQKSLSKNPRQPPSDGRSASGRAYEILRWIGSNFDKSKTVLIIAHDGILRDIIFAKHSKRSQIFDLCEIRDLDDYKNGKRKSLKSPRPSPPKKPPEPTKQKKRRSKKIVR